MALLSIFPLTLYIHSQAVLSLASLAAGQLVVYPNGAVAPFDPNNAAVTKVRNSNVY